MAVFLLAIWNMNLSTFILISLAFGVAFGTLLNTTFPENIELINQSFLAPVGESFLRLIQFVVVPIVFSSLIMGLTRIQGAGQVGRYTVTANSDQTRHKRDYLKGSKQIPQ
jgi:Na+/H+-dicarboxylate symporter